MISKCEIDVLCNIMQILSGQRCGLPYHHGSFITAHELCAVLSFHRRTILSFLESKTCYLNIILKLIPWIDD